MATAPPGFRVGHWTHAGGRTGCTVVLPPPGNVSACEIRGSAPGSRELALLDLERRHTEIHAILLTGGSAFGLAAADGVVGWLEQRGVGYETPVATIPLVPAAVVFDLGAGDPSIRPGPDQGRAACDAAANEGIEVGRVGAGAGATVGKWAGLEYAAPGGIGIGRADSGEAGAWALAVVNAVGDVIDGRGEVIAGSSAPPELLERPRPPRAEVPANTVLAVVAVEATLDKREVGWLAARGTDGITSTVRPAHTRYDGDVTFGVAAPPRPGVESPDLDVLGTLATRAAAEAVRSAVAAT